MHRDTSNSDRAETARDADHFRFLLSTQKPLLRVDEVASHLVCGKDSVYKLIEEGTLETHQGDSPRAHHRVTSRSVLGYLAKTAKYDPPNFRRIILHLVKRLPEQDRRALIEETKKL